MKATIRIVELNGRVQPSFEMEGHRNPLLPGEKILFSITDEGQPHELAPRLKARAQEEAARRGIEVRWI